MAGKRPTDYVEFAELEDLRSELDACPSVKTMLEGKSAHKLPTPIKPILRTRGGTQSVSADQSRVEQIRNFCQQRKITDICHFTRIENLQGIFSEGLLPRAELDKRPEHLRPIFPDDLRLDNNRNASCLSISFPNYKMFYLKRLQSRDHALWAVIVYDYSVLTRLNCVFTLHNAATAGIVKENIQTRNTAENLAELFGDFGAIKRNNLRIPDNYPTNPQAEVLIYETVPVNYIKEVNFYDQESAELWMQEYENIYPLDTYWMGGPIFNGRRDYAAWRKEFY